jgi:hypothetical protein
MSQTSEHTPVLHSACEFGPLTQTVPHAPQAFTLFEIAVSQPFVALPSQLPKPGLQATLHVPLAHEADWFGPALHVRPHIPQLFMSTPVGVSHPSLVLELQSE